MAIGDIKLHPVFKQPEVVEHLITTEFVLKEPQLPIPANPTKRTDVKATAVPL